MPGYLGMPELSAAAFNEDPERPANLPFLKPLANWPKFNPQDTR